MCYWTSRELTAQHQRLAEIIEMIHTASLIHDDVLDDSAMRRGTFIITTFLFGLSRLFRVESGVLLVLVNCKSFFVIIIILHV